MDAAPGRTPHSYSDRDSDGLVDDLEGEEIEHFLLGSPVQTDPELADTDGDGLKDGEEVSPVFTGSDWIVHDVDSDPTLADTDGDGLDDYEELEVWESDPMAADTSGDGFNDLVDPDPSENSTHPTITARSDSSTDYVLIQSDHESEIDSIEAEAFFDPRSPTSDPYWSDETATVTRLDDGDGVASEEYPVTSDDMALIDLGSQGLTNQEPQMVRVTLHHGDFESHYVIEVSDGDPVVVQGLMTAGFLSGSVPADAQIAFVVLVGLAVVIDLGTTSGGDLLTGAEADQTTVDGTTTQEGEIHSWPHPEKDIDIVLPSGNTREHPELEREQPFGWEQVKELPGIQQREDVGQVIEDGEIFPSPGEYDLIIGDNPGGAGKIEFYLEGLAIVAGFSLDTFDSPAHEEEIVLNEEYYHEHIKEQGDHLNRDQIEDVVEHPDSVYKGTNSRDKTIYVWEKTIGGVTYYVRAEEFSEDDAAPFTGIRIRTAYENVPAKLEELKERYGLTEIWPND